MALRPNLLNALPEPSATADQKSAESSQIDTTSRLLLICARPTLSDNHVRALRELLQHTTNWDRVLVGAQRNFVTVLLRLHLTQHAADLVPHTTQKALDGLRRWSVLRALEIARIERLLVDEILAPQNARHLFFKGANLSAQYYGGRYNRQYRDIDVLVDQTHLAAVGEALIRRGYQIYNREWAKFHTQDLAAFCQYNSALELCSPSGVIVELHKLLDNSGCIFDSADILAKAHTVLIDDHPVKTLCCQDLFVYLCFHHSRHLWSSLHWCADLEALTSHPEFDAARARSLASQLGLSATVNEALKLKTDLDQLALNGCLSAGRIGSRFLAECLSSLRKSTNAFNESPPDDDAGPQREPDFPHAWQKTTAYRWRFLLSRIHPSANEYTVWPLPVGWRWIYYIYKPIRVLKSHWKKSTNRAF